MRVTPSKSHARLWIAPTGVLYLALLVAPLLYLFQVSLLAPRPAAPLTGPFSLESYAALFDGYFIAILFRTLRIAFLTALFCLVLGYPVAISIARSKGALRWLQLLLVVSPLFVSVVVRAYGWVLILGNQGLLNHVLSSSGLVDEPLRMLYTEGAVVAALTESLLPFMVLSLASVLDRIPRELGDAARGLGASPLRAFIHVTLPMSFPGALAGTLLVFMVSMGSYATPALLGGSRVRVMVTEIYSQVTATFNWPLAAALSIALLSVSLATIAIAPERRSL